MLLTISIHSLARGRTRSGISGRKLVDISIHSLARGRTLFAIVIHSEQLPFQSTPSQEGELSCDGGCIWLNRISIHSLARGRTGDNIKNIKLQRNFNPLPRKRENGGVYQQILFQGYFNPLPRKRENGGEDIRRRKGRGFQSTPSQEGELDEICANLTYKGKFQSTPSQEGERSAIIQRQLTTNISIHSLARGRTTYIRCCPHGYGQFQSTPSQEGERQSAFSSGQTMIFQSTPSQEGERSADGLMSADDKFQSTPSQEGELRFRVQFHQKIYNFNPLPRKREN